MIKRLMGIGSVVMFCAASLFALDSEERPTLKLVPAPKEVNLRDGGFRVGRKTRILVQLGHQTEDRIAAETLAEEVADQSGLKLDIVGAKSGHKADAKEIVLARLDDPRVRGFLARRGLKADEVVGPQGYLLFSDKTHLVVAAKTGEGLFYGVQTLRQLLRPAGKGLVCPAVTIRDWPNLERTGVPDERSTGPEVLSKQFGGPRE